MKLFLLTTFCFFVAFATEAVVTCNYICNFINNDTNSAVFATAGNRHDQYGTAFDFCNSGSVTVAPQSTYIFTGTTYAGNDGVASHDICSGSASRAGGGPTIVLYDSTQIYNSGSLVNLGNLVWNGVYPTNSPYIYTNYTACINNTTHDTGWAVWTYNGSIVKQEWLSPGQSDCWTTPQLEVSPTFQNFSLVTSLTTGTQGIHYGTNPDGSPTLGFGSGGGGSGSITGSGGTVTGTGGTTDGGTNTISPTNTFYPPSTNNPIVWAPPSGAASESTLEAGFNAVVGYEQKIFDGQSILNTSINSGFYAISNQLGQVLVYQRTNNDDLGTLVRIFSTNSIGGTATNTFTLGTNAATESTLAGGFLMMTNELGSLMLLARSNNDAIYRLIGAVTNLNSTNRIAVTVTNTGLNLTNYAQENTLTSISNLLSNFLPNTNMNLSSLQDDANQGTVVDVARGTADVRGNSDYDDAVSGAPTSTSPDEVVLGPEWTISVPYLNGYTIDLNPFHYPWVVDLAALVRRLLTWSIMAGGAYYVVKEWSASQRSLSSVPQATSSQIEVLGENWWQSLISIAVAAAIIGAVVVVLDFAYNSLISWKTGFFVNPYSGVGTVTVQQSLYIADQFIPLNLVIQAPIDLYVFKLLIMQKEWIAAKVIKNLVGSPKNIWTWIRSIISF